MNMKLLILSLLTTLSLSTFAAGFPGWNATNDELETYKKEIEAKNAEEWTASRAIDILPRIEIMKEINNGNCKTFQDFCNVVDAKLNAVVFPENFKNPKEKEIILRNKALGMKKQLCMFKKIFVNDCFQFAKANPSKYDVYLARNAFLKELKDVSKAEKYKFQFDILMKYGDRDIDITTIVLNDFIDLMNDDSITTQKADLQKLNRKFTKLLIKDKAKWEPIVALIRTTLETY